METGFVIIKKETLEQLLSNFYEACSLCDEMDIYEFPKCDAAMQEMKDWAEKKFGREITKETYE